MAKATEIIGCTINGRTPSEREVTCEQSIIAKAVFNGDDIYGLFSWVRIARTQEPIFEFEDGKFRPIDSKIPYRANEDGFSFDLGTEATSPLGLCLYVQIGNGTTIMQTYIMTFYYQYFNTWTAIISPGWAWNSSEFGYDEENNVSVCRIKATPDATTKIYNEHGSVVGDITEITDRAFIDNDHYTRVGFGGNNKANNGYASQEAVSHIGIPLKYQQHISYPLAPQNPAKGYYGAGYRITGLPNGRYKVSAFMSLDKAKPYRWNCNNAEEYFDIIGDTKEIRKVDVYRRYTYGASAVINVSNNTIELLIASAYPGKIIPLNFVKLEKIEEV